MTDPYEFISVEARAASVEEAAGIEGAFWGHKKGLRDVVREAVWSALELEEESFSAKRSQQYENEWAWARWYEGYDTNTACIDEAVRCLFPPQNNGAAT